MTLAEINARVAELRELERRDRQAACAGAEVLRCEVLHAIAEGAPDAAALARAVLVTVEEDIGGE